MHYIADLIGEDYKTWGEKKIIISAPTGAGKTTFVIRILLAFHFMLRHKVLILCNRRLLREQYWSEAVRLFDTYKDMTSGVDIKTYQQVSEDIKSGVSPKNLFQGYSCIVCDEVHFFISDADFNPFGTFVLLQALLFAGLRHQMLFLSATMDQVQEELKNTFERCIQGYFRQNGAEISRECREWKEYNFSWLADYTRFQCIAVPDNETLMRNLATSGGKSVVFYDDRAEGERLKTYAIEKCGLKSRRIVVLNSDDMEKPQNTNLVEKLALCNRFDEKILITTSVLDNGISLHDDEIENIAIITDSKVSFLQMLGRVRLGKRESVNLYFVLRSSTVFRNRYIRLEKVLNLYERAESYNIRLDTFKVLHQLLSESENGDGKELRQIYVISKDDLDYCSFVGQKAYAAYGNARIVVNAFGKIKTGDLYLAEKRFYQLALDDPIRVIEEQMSWIGKKPDELTVATSTYLEDLEKNLKHELLMVQNYGKEQLQEFKKSICQKYGKNILNNVLMKSGTISNEKLRDIVERLGLIYDDKETDDAGRKLYSIREE